MWSGSAFDRTNYGAGFFNSPNQANSPLKKNKGPMKRVQSVTPVCARQIRDHPLEEFSLFGMQTHILTLVGILVELEVQSTKAIYNIEDHTGEIKAIWWLENDSNLAANLPMVKEDSYVRVHGSLRTQNGEKMLMILKLVPVENYNEVTNHLLEVIHTRLEAENMSTGSSSLAAIRQKNPGAELVNSMSFMDTDVDKPSNRSFTALQQKVYQLVRAVNTATGVDKAIILSKFPPSQHHDVNAALDFLTNEGHVYSTINNNYFKATDSA